MVKKNHYYSNPLLHKVELTALSSVELPPSNMTLSVVSPIIWVKVSPSADNDHCCSLGHASCLHSMHLSFGDGASLRGNVFGSHGSFEENVVWTGKSWLCRKRWEVEIVPLSVLKFVITKLWTNELCIVFQRIWVQSLIFVTNKQI